MTAAIGMKLVVLVTTLAVIQLMVFGLIVGRARIRYGVAAPATTGDPAWERLNRIHLNSLEQMVVFLPLLWIFATTLSPMAAAALGVAFLVARVLYAVGYAKDPARRATGAILTGVVLMLLALGSLIGVVIRIVLA